MNRPPQILVNSGFEVDQNGALTEIVTPNVVSTLDPPKKIVFNGTALNYIPSTAAALNEIRATNITTITRDVLLSYTNLTKIQMDKLSTVSYSGSNTGTFYGLSKLVTFIAPELVSITAAAPNGGGGAFKGCVALTIFSADKLESITDYGGSTETGTFNGCTGLITLNFPRFVRTVRVSGAATGAFSRCTSLENVTLGSPGHPVQELDSNTFLYCTQANLTITVYTADGLPLSGSPWGATNATVEYEEA